ncbi:MAG: cyclic peptide export ABC transporter [Rhodobacteraceae bacterium]|nr:cyclic peptide export ABC transporter [Paracoccaceae bacterium]
MSTSVTKNTRDLLRYLLRESDLLRSPVFIFVLIASASRTAMIFLINETAERGGPDMWALLALLGSAVAMLISTHWAKMSGVALVQRLTLKMRQHITKRLLAADVSFFQARPFGTIYHASTGHVGNVAQTAVRLVEITQAVMLLIFCIGYMALQMPVSVFATVVAFIFGVAAFFLTEKPATRAVAASHDATIAFHDSVRDLLNGYKELRLRKTRRDDLVGKISTQIKEAQALSIVAERHYSYGQISATGALAALLISIVVILPVFGGADSVTILQILTLVLFSFGPIETMVGDLPMIARAGVSFRIFAELDEGLQQNAEHEMIGDQGDNRPCFRSLELRGVVARLTREVGGNEKVKDSFTLGPVDLTLYPGQSVFITGGNGMGKSTLLQLLTGLRHPDDGQILIDGEDVTRANVSDYRGVFAAVFSEFYMFRHLYGLSEDERIRLQEHIEELGISEGVSIVGDQFSNLALSTGQMRRLALSIALAEKRPIIVLDEFAADQDPARRAFFYDLLVPRLARAGHCVVAVTHDEHCFGKADRLIRMEDGVIVSDQIQNPAAEAG